MKQVKSIITILLIGLIAVMIYLNQDQVMIYIDSFFNKTSELYKLGLQATGDLIDEKNLKSLEDSGITGENYTINSEYYPYYQMLNENEKIVYKQTCSNIEAIKEKFIPITKITIEEINRVVEAVYNDHPEFFWLNTNYSYKYTETGKCAQIILDYNETADNIEKHKEVFDNAVNNIVIEASKLNTNYEKEKYVHDKIIELADYDEKSSINQTSYSALVTKRTVCAGYSRAFQYIMIKLGIPTYYVVGYANEDHAWNIVKLDDGYYNVDLTWDDQTSTIYNYFNIPDNIFSETHTRTGMSSSLPKCEGTYYYNLTSKNNSSSSDVYIYSEKGNKDSDGSTNYVIESPIDKEENIEDNSINSNIQEDNYSQ